MHYRAGVYSESVLVIASARTSFARGDWKKHKRKMPSEQVLKELQELHFADDVELPPEAAEWTREEASRFLESGGTERPAAASAAPPPPPKGVFRWTVVTDEKVWDPKDQEWALLLSMLPEDESTKVMRFKFRADQKRALVSRLLQRRAAFEATGVAFDRVNIARTKGQKPYMTNRPKSVEGLGANWNYNVSHEGNYVALAAEPVLLCGIDVAAPGQVRGGNDSLDEALEVMRGQFTKKEFAFVKGHKTERTMEDAFRKLWSLKEAYTKARGDGIAFEFLRCEFQLGGPGSGEGVEPGQSVETASLKVDGKPMPEWHFFIQSMGDDHWVSTSRGPPTDAVDALGGFKKTFGQAVVPPLDAKAHAARPEPAFVTKTVADLVPDALRAKYERLAKAHI